MSLVTYEFTARLLYSCQRRTFLFLRKGMKFHSFSEIFRTDQRLGNSKPLRD